MAAPAVSIRAYDASPLPHHSAIINFTPWKLHTSITLERPHAPSIPSLSNLTRAVQHPIFMPLPHDNVQTHLYIERILSRKVAVVGCCNSTSPARWVVKFNASDWASRWHLHKELAAYAACEGLQGEDVPVFYGEWGIAGMDPAACSVLLMEYVAPGTTIVALQAGVDRENIGGRERLVRGAVLATERVNRCGVAHRDLSGENMMVAEGGRVVIVGFAWAAVGRLRSADRWSLFQMGFLTAWDVPEME
ncbi:hypothetical protein Q9L58_006891 [Maublancomyces gigas]|uniref:Protein kinase domain-containing protein n=1 Tax=Discina gigas TaxID=1032678 RepID=A0ABR3GE77_9PEZI